MGRLQSGAYTLPTGPCARTSLMPPSASTSTQSEFARSVFRNNLGGEGAYARHVRYINQFQNVYSKEAKSPAKSGKTELDGLIQGHKYACVNFYVLGLGY